MKEENDNATQEVKREVTLQDFAPAQSELDHLLRIIKRVETHSTIKDENEN